MAAFLFSTSSGSFAFDPLVDTFDLDVVSTTNPDAITLAPLQVGETASGVSFTYAGKTVTLTGVTLEQLSASLPAGAGNIWYDNTASTLSFGDNNAATLSDAAQSVTGSTVDDLLIGGDGNDTFQGGQGSDQLFGYGGNDELRGGMGNDTLDGGAGDDYMIGATGDDVISGGDGNDLINESNDIGTIITGGEASPAGMNVLSGNAGNDTILGGTGDDDISGGMDNDLLRGNVGNDVIRGGDGNDTIEGGVGDDELSGGAGSDEFLFSADANFVAGGDTIGGFQRGSDKIVLTDAGGAELSGAAIASSISSIIVSGGDSIVTLTNGQTIRVSGVTTLDATDFKNAATPNVTISDEVVVEGGMATFTVTLSAASAFDTTINFSTSSGTATEGADFTSGDGGQLVILAGMTTGSIVISTTQDTAPEGSETFNVNLTSATNATITDATGVGTITDNDTAPDLTSIVSSFVADNSPASLDTSVTVSSGTTNSVTADWDGGSLSVSSNGGATITLGGGVTLLGGGAVIVGGNLIGTVTNAFGDTSASITFNSFATTADVETIIENLLVADVTGTPSSQNLTITLINGDGNSDVTTVAVTTAADTALAISNLDGDSTLVQTGDAAVTIDTGLAASQNLGTSQGTAANSTLTVAITAGVDADDDHLSLGGAVTIFNDTFVVVGGNVVGTITGNNGTSFTIQFNGSATDSDVNTVIQAVTFDTDVGGNDGDRTITATLTSGVSSDSDVVTATVSVAGNVFVLTTADDSFTGTSGVDVFSGAGGVSAAAGTLNDGDELDGGAGSMSDRLIADLGNGMGAGDNVDPTISNINFFELTSTGSTANTLDFANITDVTDITVFGGTDLLLDNLTDGVTQIDAAAFTGALTVDVGAGSGDVTILGGSGDDTFNFGATLNGGSGDSIDGGGGMDTLNGEITANYVAHIDNVEVINITAQADYTIDAADITGTGVALNLSDGASTDSDLTVTNLGSAVTTLDASAITGTGMVTATFTGAADVTVVGSVGDDVFNFGTTLTGADNIDTGAGTDTVNATLAAGVTALTPDIDDAETINLSIEEVTSAVALSTGSITGTGMTLNLSNGSATDVDVTIGAFGSVLTTLNASGLDASTDSLDVTFNSASDVTVTGSEGNDTLAFGGTLTAADDVDGGMGADVLSATLSGALTIGAGMLDNVETLNLIANGGAAYGVSIAAATGVTTVNLDVDDADTDTTLTLADSVTTVDIDDGTIGGGMQNITVDGLSASSMISSINAAGLDDSDDSLTVDGSMLTATLTVVGSAGGDVITGGSGSDDLSGGDGADTITSGSGTDIINGGAGDDTLVFGANLTAADDVSGGAGGGDTLTATLAGSFTATAGNLDLVETLTFAVTADAIVNVAAATGVATINLDLSNDDTTVTATVADSVTTVDFDGTDDNLDVTVNGIGAMSSLATVDASGLTATDSSLFVDASLSATALTATGSAGNDSVTGGTGGDALSGGGGDDVLTGNGGADDLLGNAGLDTLSGGAGTDDLTGGDGADSLTGGADGDTFIYTGTTLAALQAESATVGEGGTGRDRITDFAIGDDLIDVDAFNGGMDIIFIGTGSFTGGGMGADFAEVRYAQSGSDTVVQFDLDNDGDADASIVLTGLYTLGASDFNGVV